MPSKARATKRLYRLYTEQKNVPGIRDILNEYFTAYTIIPATGTWNSTVEDSVVLEVYTEPENEGWLIEAAKRIKIANSQDAVLLVSVPCEGQLI